MSKSKKIEEEYKQMLKLTTKSGDKLDQRNVDSQATQLPQLTELSNLLRDEYSAEEQGDRLDLMRQFLPQYQQIMADQTNTNRMSDLQAVIDMSPMVSEANKAAMSPENRQMLDMLNADALSGLQSGSKLDENMIRDINNSVRSGQISRGTGMGSGDVNREALAKVLEGFDLKRERQGFAANMIGTNNQNTKDPFVTVLGNPNSNFTSAMQAFSSPVANPTMAGLPVDTFSQAYNVGSLAQNQQQYDLNKSQYDLQKQLAYSQAGQFGIF